MGLSGKRMTWITWLWVAEIAGACDLCGVESKRVGGDWCFMVARQRRPTVKANLCTTLAVCHAHNWLHNSASQLVAYRPILCAGIKRRTQVCEATASRAKFNASGNSLPRFSARRRIPAHAVELKKNLDGIDVVSSTCDNEHTTASLGHSEVLGVEDPPRDCARGSKHTTSVAPLSPWCDERIIFAGKSRKKASEGVVFGGQNSGDVLPKDNGGLMAARAANVVDCIGDLAEGEGKIAASIVKRLPQTGDGKGLARRATAEKIRRLNLTAQDAVGQRGHVAEVRDIRVVVR
jgi:hypothetical protein